MEDDMHMDDFEFWLPFDFLSDDTQTENESGGGAGDRMGFPSEFPYGGYDLASSEGSVLSSTEAESDEDEFAIAGAARLQPATKNNSMSSSPQSTLWSAGTDHDGWDLITSAAEKSMRLKLDEDRGSVLPPYKPAASTGYFFNPALAHVPDAKVCPLYLPLGRNSGNKKSINGRHMMNLPSPLRPLPWPHQTNYGMRAIFLAGSGTRRESVGTGVFLPRTPGTLADHSRKPTGSTVLIPARVVQALNLDLDEAGVAWPRLPSTSQPCPARGNSGRGSISSRRGQTGRPATSMNTTEYHLPPEWTY